MTTALWGLPRLRDPAGLPYRRLVVEILAISAGVLLVGAAAGSGWAQRHVPAAEAAIGLTILAGALSLVITVLWLLVARFSHDGRPAWAAAALAVYGLVGVPATTLGSAFETGRALTGTARLAGHAVMTLMLIFSTFRLARQVSVRGVRVRGVHLIVVGVAIPMIAALLATLDPSVATEFTARPPVRWAVVVLWLIAAALMAYRGLAAGLSPNFRVGLGILVLALAHAYRIVSEPAQSTELPSLTFCSVRLLGLLIMFSGASELARRAVRGIRAAQLDHQEKLLVAEDGLARRAELDHELRNGIAGIAGAAGVLSGSSATDEQALLQSVVTDELTRLDELLSPDRD